MRTFLVTVNGDSYEVTVEEVGGVSRVSAPAPTPAAAPGKTPAAPSAAGGEKVICPMPGNILDVKAQAGQQVKAGDILMILEAMKMENEILAPVDGKVLEVLAAKGATVNTGDVLAVVG
ncbi:MAG: biotin/lipoyl-binding protein [Firmicutes bacterium]|nr:biotin/lipoyl-binding protein [Bacillota bacterium]